MQFIFIDVKPVFVWEKLAVVSLVFISLLKVCRVPLTGRLSHTNKLLKTGGKCDVNLTLLATKGIRPPCMSSTAMLRWWNVHAWKAINHLAEAVRSVHFSSKMAVNDVMCNPPMRNYSLSASWLPGHTIVSGTNHSRVRCTISGVNRMVNLNQNGAVLTKNFESNFKIPGT